MSKWNREHPWQRISPGQAIFQVNGCHMSSEMMEELRSADCLEMLVCTALTPLQEAMLCESRRKRRTREWLDAILKDVEAHEDHCSICLEALESLEGSVVELPCAHCFHKTCISRWLGSGTSHMRCPLCNRSFHP